MDTWDASDGYDDYMGRWSEPIAREFLDWLDIAPGSRWVDIGCGTGALAAAIAAAVAPTRLAGVDPSAGFIEAARRRLTGDPDLRVGDAQALPFDSSSFDATVSGLALNFVPDPEVALSEMRRVTRNDGTVAAYVWDYADGMQMIRAFWDAAVALNPSTAHLDEATRFPLCRPGPLFDLFESSGLRDVDVTALEIPTVFRGFDEYWRPMLGDQGPAPSYVGSLDEHERQRLESRLRRDLPESADGTIGLTARAWAVRGLV
ncbi:MAG: methyltransferase domain-containing protein [Actinomycetota bacterium]